MYYWKKRIYTLDASSKPKETLSKDFVELPSYDKTLDQKKSGIEICIKDVTITIEQEFEEATLARVISLLGRTK